MEAVESEKTVYTQCENPFDEKGMNVNIFFFLGHETENKTCFTIRTLMVSFNNFQISLTKPLIHFCDFPLKNIIANLFLYLITIFDLGYIPKNIRSDCGSE